MKRGVKNRKGVRSAKQYAAQERTYADSAYWNKLHRQQYRSRSDNAVAVGDDGAEQFDREVLERTKGKVVLDVGCGVGQFTFSLARKARRVVGVDFSRVAITGANDRLSQVNANRVTFKRASADGLPFPDQTFDVVVSRRGPVTSSTQCIREARRVLKRGGVLMEITIGERDKASIARIFGRGQMFDIKEPVAVTKRRMLNEADFHVIQIEDHLATEVFKGMSAVVARLKATPIIPGFDVKADKVRLLEVAKVCATQNGIESEKHRVTIIAERG